MTPARRTSMMTAMALILTVGGACSIGTAQTTPARKPADPVLKGPKVKDRDVPGVAPEFGSTVDKRFAERLPPEEFRKALSVLTADDAPAEIRATPAQSEMITALVAGFEDEVKAYRREHAKEIAALRKQAGEQEPRRGRPPEDMPMKDDAMGEEGMTASSDQDRARDEARAKLRELQAGAPQISKAYTQIWAQLNEPQRKAVDAKLDEFREAQARKREEDYVRRRVGQKKQAGGAEETPMRPAPAAGDAEREKSPARPGALSPERRERLIKMLEQLTPEEQDAVLQRLEQRLKEFKRVGNGRRGDEAGAGSKPAPDPSDVDVPSPEGKK